MRHLVQAHDAGAAVGGVAQGKGQALQVLRGVAGLGVQAHVDVVGLVVGGAPVAHGLASHQGAQAAADLRHAQAQVGRHIAAHFHVERGLVGLEGRIQVYQAGHVAQLVQRGLGEALQGGRVGALKGKQDLLGSTHRIKQADVGNADARNLLQARAQLDGHLVNAEFAVLAVHQADVDAGVDFSLRIAGVDGGQGVAHLWIGAHDGFDLAGFGLGHFQRSAGGGVEVERGLREVRLGHKLGAQERHHGHAQRKHGHCQQHRLDLVHQRPGQYALVAMGQRLGGPLKPAGNAAQGAVVQGDRRAAQAVVFHRRVVPDARQHGVQRKADKHGNQHRHHNGQAKLVKKLADDAAHKTNGQKHRHDGQGGGQHRQANLLRAVKRGLERRFAHLHVAHDVFAHHDGVVNQQAHAQAQRHHGDHVQGKTQHVHEQKRADDGNGQRQPRNHGRAPRVQKQENNQHG